MFRLVRSVRPALRCAIGLAFALATACEGTPTAAPPADASVRPPPPPPPRDGCARTGSIEALEGDPTCVVRRANDDAMRSVMRHLSITATLEPPEVIGGGTALLGITIRNTADTETLVLFEARPRAIGPRTDWARVAGIPEQREPNTATPEVPRLFFTTMTTDSYGHDVDALPMIAGSGGVPLAPTILAVRLRPGGKLTHHRSWWALRIPAPASIVQDEAGHRYIPKTSALPLTPGEYGIVIELPLFGLSREERKITARAHVVRAPSLDGGPGR